MNVPDVVNALFEFGGSIVLWFNVVQTYRDKGYRGVTVASTFFFSTWGYWNLYYYPSLNQWLSFFGGCSIVAANTAWLVLMLYYGHTEFRKSA
jgi:hypothetical protein